MDGADRVAPPGNGAPPETGASSAPDAPADAAPGRTPDVEVAGRTPDVEVAGIVLAAGGGRRYGRPKALVELAGRLLVERAVAALAGGGCRPVLAVLGAAAAEVQATAALGDAVVVVNDRWAEGMGGSLRLGLDAAGRAGAAAAVVLLVDQPVIGAELVARLVDAWRTGAVAARAAFGGEGRTPVVLDRSLWPEVVAGAVGDVGARHVLAAHRDLVVLVDCDDVGAACDVDTPERLRAVEARYGAMLATDRPPRPPG